LLDAAPYDERVNETQPSPWASIAFPILTERLVLRPFELTDFDGLLDISSRPDVARFVPWEPRDAQTIREVLTRRTDGTQDGLSIAAILRSDDTLVGDISVFSLVPEHGTAEIGFIFHPDHHGLGLAGEACEAILDVTFGQLDLHRIVARCDARNAASSRLLERLGMRLEAHQIENEFLKGEWTDELDYAILAREWRLGRSQRLSEDS
jgi:RimJ/RimL family protein N-acetyltransferase